MKPFVDQDFVKFREQKNLEGAISGQKRVCVQPEIAS
jgi:hypothetical protein